jgi:hypothetical protein
VCGARSAPLGGGGREGVRGNRGTRALGGSRVPLALAGFRARQDRRGMRVRCRAPSPVMSAAGSVVAGRQEGGLGGTSEPGRLECSGGFRGSPQIFQPPFPCCLCLQSRAVVFPTSPSCSLRGRGREHGSGAAPAHPPRQQGGPGRDRSAQRPHTQARGLYGWCAGT